MTEILVQRIRSFKIWNLIMRFSLLWIKIACIWLMITTWSTDNRRQGGHEFMIHFTRRLFYLEETVYELERNSDDSMWRRVVNQRSTNLSGRRNAWIPPKYLIFDPNPDRVKFWFYEQKIRYLFLSNVSKILFLSSRMNTYLLGLNQFLHSFIEEMLFFLVTHW